MSEYKTVGDHWLDYHAKVLPPNCGEIQLKESRRAFYAGAQAFRSLSLSCPEDWTDQELDDHFRRVSLEIDSFYDSVTRGEA